MAIAAQVGGQGQQAKEAVMANFNVVVVFEGPRVVQGGGYTVREAVELVRSSVERSDGVPPVFVAIGKDRWTTSNVPHDNVGSLEHFLQYLCGVEDGIAAIARARSGRV
jgi:hypothetical protein